MLMNDTKPPTQECLDAIKDSLVSDTPKQGDLEQADLEQENPERGDLDRAKEVFRQLRIAKRRRVKLGAILSSVACGAVIAALFLVLPPLALSTVPVAQANNHAATISQGNAFIGGYLLIGVIALSLIGALILYWLRAWRNI